MKKLGKTQLVSATAHGIDLSLPDGAAFSVQVLEEQLVRVRLRPAMDIDQLLKLLLWLTLFCAKPR